MKDNSAFNLNPGCMFVRLLAPLHLGGQDYDGRSAAAHVLRNCYNAAEHKWEEIHSRQEG